MLTAQSPGPAGATGRRRTTATAHQDKSRSPMGTIDARAGSEQGDALNFHQDLAEQMIVEVQSWNESAGADLDELGPLASAAVSPEMLTSLLATAAAENRTQVDELLVDTPHGRVPRSLTCTRTT